MSINLSELIAGILDEIAPQREFGPEFDAIQARDAHTLLMDTARRVKNAPRDNRAGMFPRITVAELGDLRTLAEALDAYGKQNHEHLVNAIRAYALGSDAFTLTELQLLADAYVDGARLANGVIAELKRHKNGDAVTADFTMDAVSAYPQEFSVKALADRAQTFTEVTEPLAQGQKIKAIKELRLKTNASLALAKEAVELVLDRWENNKHTDWEQELLNSPDQN